MNYALNKKVEMVDIENSIQGVSYTCPICGDVLLRKVGSKRSYFSHSINKENDCELKMSEMLKVKGSTKEDILLKLEESDFMDKVYANYLNDDIPTINGMTDEQLTFINSTEKRIKCSAVAGCVDSDTEFFNGKGWKKISEWDSSDMVLQFSNDRRAELVNPIEYIKEECNLMHRYKTKYGVDMVLSEEHRIVYIDTSHYNKKDSYLKNRINIKSEKEVREMHNNSKVGFSGKIITAFKPFGSNSTGLSENELRLTIAIMADGHFPTKSTNWCRINIKKEYKKERLELLLNLCGIKYRKEKYNQQDLEYDNYLFYSPLNIKHYPKEWYSINEDELNIIYDEIDKWDGTDNSNTNRGKVFRTTSKDDADFIQFVFHSLGSRASINIDDRVGDTYTLSTNKKEYITKSILYSVAEVGRTNVISFGAQSKTENKNKVITEFVPIDGLKYCFKVPSGMLILRRDGNIFITGNSGKSHTLYHYLKKRPFQKKLYIVFNVNMANEAKLKFSDIPNLDVRTNFSLAFKYEGFKYKDRIKNTLSIYDYCKLANVFAKTPEDFEYVETLKYFYDLWLASEKLTFEEFFKDEKCSRYTQKGVETIWNNMKDIKSKHPVTHQFYMKSWGIRQPNLSKDYDIIGCDEQQDNSCCLSNIIINCKVDTIVCVFDPKQELYSFANPQSGAELLGDEFISYPLSYCFRIGNTLADLSVKIFEFFEKKPFKFIGMNKEQRIVKHVDRDKKHVVLCRSNYEILMQAIKYVAEGKIFNIEGRKELNYDFSTIEHVYKFKYYGDKALFLKRFESYEQMKTCMMNGNKVFDMELSSAIKVVEELGSKTLDKLNELKSKLTNRENADVVFSTTHQAKGLTIKEPVVIADDYINIFSILESGDVIEFSDIKDALFLLYVALTRSCGEVEVNDFTLMFYDGIVNGKYEIVDSGNELKKLFNNIINKEIKETKKLIFD